MFGDKRALVMSAVKGAQQGEFGVRVTQGDPYTQPSWFSRMNPKAKMPFATYKPYISDVTGSQLQSFHNCLVTMLDNLHGGVEQRKAKCEIMESTIRQEGSVSSSTPTEFEVAFAKFGPSE